MLPKLALDHVTVCSTHNYPQPTKFFGLDWMSKTTLKIYIYFEFSASGGNQEKNHMHSELEISCQHIHPAHKGYETQMQGNGQQQKLCSSLLVIFPSGKICTVCKMLRGTQTEISQLLST